MPSPDKSVPNALAVTAPTRMPGSLVVRAVNRATGESRTFTPAHPFAILGRAAQAGVRLDDPSVSQCHAYLQLVDGVPYCIDLGSRTGVLWDDGNQGRGWIHPGQTVRVGIFDVQIDSPDAAPGADPGDRDDVPHAALDIYSPTTPSGRFSLDLPVTLVGRHPNCNLRFIDEGLAYFQCAIVNTRQRPWCVDLLSPRGTALNGRATRLAPLRDGDLIEIGRVSLVVRVGPPAPLARAGPADVSVSPFPVGPHASVESVLEPLRGMMEQFQQSFVTMARMFTTMQQEHTAMMCEQMRQVQEMLREVRDGRALPATPAAPPAPAASTATPPPPVAEPKPPTPKPVTPEDGRRLADAHAWFLDRLTRAGGQSGGKPKSE